MDFKTELENLQQLHTKKRYFEVISKGVQFIDYFCTKLLEEIPIDEVEKYNDIDEIEAHTGYKFDEWKDLKKEISKSLYKEESWKYKIFQYLDQELNPGLSSIVINKKLITKIRNLHSIRNKIQHEYYISNLSKKQLENTSKDSLEICKLLEEPIGEYYDFHKNNTAYNSGT